MARLAGILDEPEQAPICLGCHATAGDSEKWERDPAFRLEDGVQCEKCHGPGSEYMAEKVMKDPEAARRAGLRKFTKRDCAVCHYVKGSHAAVHQKPQLDIEAAWRLLAHPVPKKAAGAATPRPPPADVRWCRGTPSPTCSRRRRPVPSTWAPTSAARATRGRSRATSSACGG